jgi:hypothetical protein
MPLSFWSFSSFMAFWSFLQPARVLATAGQPAGFPFPGASIYCQYPRPLGWEQAVSAGDETTARSQFLFMERVQP